MFPKGISIGIGILVLTGCVTGEPSLKVSPRDVSGAYCAPLFTMPAGLASPLSVPSRLESSPELERLSYESRQIAAIIGVADLVRETTDLEALHGRTISDEARHRLVETRQQLSDRLVAVFFEVSSVAGRIDCEATRATHVAAALTETHDRRARRYEITAIVGDALIGIVGGGLTIVAEETAAGIAEVVGGTFATGFGLAAGFTGEEHEFLHPQKRNLLGELWEGPERPTMFPLSVWRFLNWPLENAAEYRTRRDELLAEWRNDGLIGDAGPLAQRATLFFGPGGTYDIDDLRARVQMLDVVKTSLSVMMQHLYLFSQEVLNQQRVAAR